MQHIKNQAENLLLSFLQTNPMSVMDMIFIQPAREEYRHGDEEMTPDSLALDCGNNSIRCFFKSRAGIISKVSLKSEELNAAIKAHKEVEHFSIDNEKLSYSDKLKVKILLSFSMEKFLPLIEHLMANLESSEVKALEATVSENKSLNAYMSFHGALTHCSLSRGDLHHLKAEYDSKFDKREFNEGCTKLFGQLKNIYLTSESPSFPT